MKYYYKFKAQTSEGKALRSFHRSAMKAELESEMYAKKVGAMGYYEDPKAYVGGVVAVTFSDPSKVNKNIWRLVGKQAEDNEFLYIPNVTIEVGSRILKSDEKTPRNNAHIIWNKPINTKMGRKVSYIDIKPVAINAPKSDRKRAIQAEIWRLKLPVISVDSFYKIVHAEVSDADLEKQQILPIFYCYHGYYYIGLDYPIHQDGFEEINQYIFNTTKRDLLFEQQIDKNGKDEY